MGTVRLYSQTMNPFAEKVVCALALKGVDHLRVEVSEADEIKRLDPDTQKLPVLEIDGRRMADSPAIVRWLEELYPKPSLFAADPKTRQQQQGLADWSDSSFAWYWNRWRTARAAYESERASREPGLLSRLHQRVERRIGFDSGDAAETSPREQEILVGMSSRMDDLLGFLGNREFFYSDRPSVADLSVYGMLLVMRDGPMPGSADLLEKRPALVDHCRRMDLVARG